jgi:hypothetical protein
MPIPITLQIPTIIKYDRNLVYRNSNDNIIIKGTKFDNNCVVYFYTGVNFLSGFSYTPNFISSTEIRVNNISAPQNMYSMLVYNTSTKLYSNSVGVEVKNSVGFAPELVTNKFYTSGVILNTDVSQIQSVFTNNTNYPTLTPQHNARTLASNVFGDQVKFHQNKGGFILKFAGRNITPDTVFLIRDGLDSEKYYPLTYDNVYGIFTEINANDIQHLVNESAWYTYVGTVGSGLPPISQPVTTYSMTNVLTTNSGNIAVYMPRLAMPYGNHFLVAVNKYGISNEIPFSLSSNQFSSSTHNNIENDTHYDYEIGSCGVPTTLKAIDNKSYKIERYLPFLFSNPTNIRKRVYTLKTSIFNAWDPIKVYAIDAGLGCAQLNCLASDVFPIGSGTSKFMTGQSTVFNGQCPVEVIGLAGTGANGATPVWEAWKLYSTSGASPAIPICGEQGELTKTFTIEFASKVIAANFDLTAQIISAASNSLNVTIERWNNLTSAYEVIVNNVSTGSWSTGTNITKTIPIPSHTSTFKYRISLTALVDSSLNPTHLLKTSKLY